MRKISFLLLGLAFATNYVNAQVYKLQDTILSVFTINDTLKYFEFYTPEYPHGNVGCGIISKVDQNVFGLAYADASNYNKFKMDFRDKTVDIIRTSEHGFIPYSLERNANRFKIINDKPQQNVSHFYLNYPIFYKANKKVVMRVYEYPCSESKIKKIPFNKGAKIEQRWTVGLYNKHNYIKDKTWIAAVCDNKFIGWLLLSDVDASFVNT